MKKSAYLITALTAVALLAAVGGAGAATKSFKATNAALVASATKTATLSLSNAAAAKIKTVADRAAQKLLNTDLKALKTLQTASGKSKAVSAAYNFAKGTNGVAVMAGNTALTTGGNVSFVLPAADLATIQGGTSYTSLNQLKTYWSTTLKADKISTIAATKPTNAAIASAYAALLKGSSTNCLGNGATSYTSLVGGYGPMGPPAGTPTTGNCTF